MWKRRKWEKEERRRRNQRNYRGIEAGERKQEEDCWEDKLNEEDEKKDVVVEVDEE